MTKPAKALGFRREWDVMSTRRLFCRFTRTLNTGAREYKRGTSIFGRIQNLLPFSYLNARGFNFPGVLLAD
jgi:hypothetical protein